ncbi:MAG: LPS-assembly protein LptD [Deltaproteobacteria bacterium]|nr:LPS-assembly protein LptD [Deltaproteobacteria bacterium]
MRRPEDYRSLALVLVLAVASVATTAHGDPAEGLFEIGAGGKDDSVSIDADSITYSEDGEEVQAAGDVVISSGTSILAADEISYQRVTGQADASGSVVLEDPSGRVHAEHAWVEMQDETGYLTNGEIFLRDSRFLLDGDRLEKDIGHSYRIWEGEFTTCLCSEGAPDWSIEAEQIDVTLGGWAEVREGTFKVAGTPILKFPYGLFPVLRDRQSGFLFPAFGISNARGFQYTQPFYWAINKSSDATISLDVETSARIGILTDYRYLLSPDAGGRMTLSYFNESIRGDQESEVVDIDQLADPDIPENRWSVIGYHQQPGPWESDIYLRPFYVSDNLFLREMNTLSYVPATNLFLTTIRYTISEAGIVKVQPWGLMKAEAVWYQDLIQKQSRVPQPIPRLTLNARTPPLFEGLRLGANTQAVYYYRAPLSSGPRFDFAPQAMMPYRLGNYAFGSFNLILRETLYYLVNNEFPVPPQMDGMFDTRTVDQRFQSREILQFNTGIQSEVSRIYELEKSSELTKVKHTIEPFLRYNYIPLVNQDDIPIYDALDRINARNLVTYGVLTRLLGKFGGLTLDSDTPPGETLASPSIGEEPYGPPAPALPTGVSAGQIRELGRAQVQQSYEISRPIFATADDPKKKEHLSGVDTFLRLTPVRWAGLNSRTVYSVADNKFVFANVGANLWDPRPIVGDSDIFRPELRPVNQVSLFYQFNSGGAVQNLNAATTVRLNNHLALSYLGRFDADEGEFLENWAGFRVISGCDCWTFDAAFVDRVNPDEIEFRFRFSLVGLGTFGQSPFAEFANVFPTPAASAPDFGAVY